MVYTVKYKRGFFKKKLKKVKGDGFNESYKSRFFILEDETRVEIPVKDTIFEFSRERFISIKQRMESESGQEMKIRKQ